MRAWLFVTWPLPYPRAHVPCPAFPDPVLPWLVWSHRRFPAGAPLLLSISREHISFSWWHFRVLHSVEMSLSFTNDTSFQGPHQVAPSFKTLHLPLPADSTVSSGIAWRFLTALPWNQQHFIKITYCIVVYFLDLKMLKCKDQILLYYFQNLAQCLALGCSC